ncbi:MAG: hypothetical protein ACSHXI_07005 [Hoeflea sp.]|uniref:hypothetical protein n=1 Tax=Hoeflea sp. TaxID=1940281 RepID=UPI003EF18012
MPDTAKTTASKPSQAEPVKQAAVPVDPILALITALSADAGDEAARKQARADFSAIATAGRPWEQLPSGLKAAARADARELVDSGNGKAASLLNAGYHPSAVDRLLHDLGAL